MKEISKFIALEASAGSGKTHNLTKRYIKLLLNFDSDKDETVRIQNILALTFANKATVEMKERIIENLKKLALEINVEGLTDSINMPKSKIQKNALTAINTLISNYDSFNVRTIDSFINLIIKSCALKLGFSPNYKILETYEDYIDYSVDSFLNKGLVDKSVEQILNGFFGQFLIDGGNSWDLKTYISNKFKEFYKKEVSKEFVINDTDADYFTTVSLFAEEFNKVCCSMTKIKEFAGLNGNFKGVVEKIKNNPGALFQMSSTAFQKEDLPYNKNSERSERLDELFEEAKRILNKYVEFKSKHFYDNYIKIFKYVINEFDNRTKKDSVLFLQDINRKVLNIFDQDTLVPEIYCRLSSSFKDFLIDEFQDTNKIQWETLRLIVEENLSQEGSFFYVGDKKQAIYGFRGSDFQIFDLPLKEFEIYQPHKNTLDINYRSYQAIVDFNNSVFSKENIEQLLKEFVSVKKIEGVDNYCAQLADVFETSFQKVSKNKKNSGYVDIAYYEYDKKEEDIDDKVKDYLYKTIDGIIKSKKFEYKDITILCRWGNEVEKIGKWLLEKNINIESFKTLNIVNSDIVKELFSALQFFNSPIDNLAFTSFVTSSIFLKQTKLSKQEMLSFIHNNSLGKNRQNALYIEFREAYPQIWEQYIENFFNSVGFIAVYEFAVSIIAKFKVMENFEQSSDILLTFLDVISDFETREQGLQNFIDYFKDYERNKTNEKFFIKVPSDNAVKIMTIHKAKGLQFNVVIMPYFYIEDSAPKNPFCIEKDNKFSFMKITQDFIPYSDKLKDFYYKAYFKCLSDELNILYVATTRAVCEFYALIAQPKKKKDEKDLITVLVKESFRNFGTKNANYDLSKKEEKVGTITLNPDRVEDIVDIISDSANEIYGRKHKDMLLKGQIMHYALSLIYTFDDSDLCNIIKSCMEKVSVMYPNEDISWLEKTINNLLLNKNVSCFFDKANKVFNEKEFVDKFGNTIRIDKLVVKNNDIGIIDFKSSIYDKEYIQKQIRNYYYVLSEIYKDKKINLFVVDIEKNEVSEIKI